MEKVFHIHTLILAELLPVSGALDVLVDGALLLERAARLPLAQEATQRRQDHVAFLRIRRGLKTRGRRRAETRGRRRRLQRGRGGRNCALRRVSSRGTDFGRRGGFLLHGVAACGLARHVHVETVAFVPGRVLLVVGLLDLVQILWRGSRKAEKVPPPIGFDL